MAGKGAEEGMYVSSSVDERSQPILHIDNTVNEDHLNGKRNPNLMDKAWGCQQRPTMSPCSWKRMDELA